MDKVYFKPWVGKNYRGNDRRLLLLGESHYCDGSESENFTIELTQDFITGDNKHQFWTRITEAVDGHPISEIDKGAFWHGVAFYNFIQEAVAETPGVAPSREMIERAQEPFMGVLRELKPTHLLCLVKRLWEWLPDPGKEGPTLEFEGKAHDTWYFEAEPGTYTFATWMKHPSYISPPKWHPLISSFLTY